VHELWNHGVFNGRKFSQEVMELEDETNLLVSDSGQIPGRPSDNRSPSNKDPPLGGPVERAENVKQGRLPSSARADDGHRFSTSNLEAHPPQNFEFTPVSEAKDLVEILGEEREWGLFPVGWAIYSRVGVRRPLTHA
jgi:hypothetical protein